MLVLTKADNGQKISVMCGDIIQIELREQGGTGYLWQFDDLDKQYFDLINLETKKIQKKDNFTGGPVLKRWQLKAKKAGPTTLQMYYFRPWEDRSKAADKFNLSVHIK